MKQEDKLSAVEDQPGDLRYLDVGGSKNSKRQIAAAPQSFPTVVRTATVPQRTAYIRRKALDEAATTQPGVRSSMISRQPFGEHLHNRPKRYTGSW